MIRRAFRIPAPPAPAGTIAGVYLARFFGLARGLVTATAVALKEPLLLAESNRALKAKLELFRAGMSAALQAQMDEIGKALSKIPEASFQQSITEVVAGYEGQQAASLFVQDAVNLDTPDDPITEQIDWFLWMFWAEVETAASVSDLHLWMTRMRFLSCSPKLLEKICTKVGFRPGGRGRRKRIPTLGR